MTSRWRPSDSFCYQVKVGTLYELHHYQSICFARCQQPWFLLSSYLIGPSFVHNELASFQPSRGQVCERDHTKGRLWWHLWSLHHEASKWLHCRWLYLGTCRRNPSRLLKCPPYDVSNSLRSSCTQNCHPLISQSDVLSDPHLTRTSLVYLFCKLGSCYHNQVRRVYNLVHRPTPWLFSLTNSGGIEAYRPYSYQDFSQQRILYPMSLWSGILLPFCVSRITIWRCCFSRLMKLYSAQIEW